MRSVKEEHLTRSASPKSGMTVWGKVAVAFGVVAVVLVATVFFVSETSTKETLYNVGFVALLVAGVAAVCNWVQGRGERVTVAPGTVLGWWAVGLLVACVALIVTALLGGESATNVADVAEPLAVGAGVASAVAALMAFFRKGERSVPVILLGVFPGLFVVFFLLGELVLPH